MSVQTAFAEKVPVPVKRDDRLPAMLRDDADHRDKCHRACPARRTLRHGLARPDASGGKRRQLGVVAWAGNSPRHMSWRIAAALLQETILVSDSSSAVSSSVDKNDLNPR